VCQHVEEKLRQQVSVVADHDDVRRRAVVTVAAVADTEDMRGTLGYAVRQAYFNERHANDTARTPTINSEDL